MPSVLNVDTIADKAGTGPVALTKQEAAKIWLLYNSSGAIADSFNISTVTDHQTGDFTENYSNNMSTVNYTKIGSSGQADGGGTPLRVIGQNEDNEVKTTNTMRLYNLTSNAGGAADNPRISTTTHGDLA
tara:strand:+ start:545 stop:934 length:390 start_codon:yes stop_codon:yes gene_type:complete